MKFPMEKKIVTMKTHNFVAMMQIASVEFILIQWNTLLIFCLWKNILNASDILLTCFNWLTQVQQFTQQLCSSQLHRTKSAYTRAFQTIRSHHVQFIDEVFKCMIKFVTIFYINISLTHEPIKLSSALYFTSSIVRAHQTLNKKLL